MSLTIDHIVLPAHDHVASARFLAGIIGHPYAGPERHFAPVRVSDTFTLLYLQVERFEPYHLGFHVDDDDVEHIVGQLTAGNIPYGNDPREVTNMRTDHPFGGRGLFFLDPNGHLLEVMTIVRPT